MKTFNKASLALALVGAIGNGSRAFTFTEPTEAGMSSSALTGVLDTDVCASQLVVSFKVINAADGSVVWQSDVSGITVSQDGAAESIHHVAIVEGSFRPTDSRYEWVMVVDATRASLPVHMTGYGFNAVFDRDHAGVVPVNSRQGRLTELQATIWDCSLAVPSPNARWSALEAGLKTT